MTLDYLDFELSDDDEGTNDAVILNDSIESDFWFEEQHQKLHVQYSEDGENWENIAGATGQTHEETVTPMNANGYWRVLVKKQAETQKGE